jgi:transposase
VPDDHPVREIAAVLDLSWVHSELAPYYPRLGRPSIDPVLMIRMLIVGYVFGIRSERALCRDVRVNHGLAPRSQSVAITVALDFKRDMAKMTSRCCMIEKSGRSGRI